MLEAPSNQFIQVVPNPASQITGCLIQCSDSFIGETMELISYEGKVVATIKITANQMALPMQKLAKGNYYIKASNEQGTITKKVLVQ